MKIQQYLCDCGCGSIRQKSNHWWMVIGSECSWSICEWREDYETRGDVKHAAGQECAHKLLDQFMSGNQEEKTI